MSSRILTLALLLTMGNSALGQQVPNLSGTWTDPANDLVKAPLPAIGKTGTGVKGAATVTLTQSGDSLVWTGNGLTYAYALNGGETINCMRSQGVCFPNRCRAHWDAAVLYLSCRSAFASGREIITNEHVWLDPDGNLRMEGRVVTQGVTTTMRSIFRKQTTLIFES